MTGILSDDDDDGSVSGTSGADTIFGGTSTSSPDGGAVIDDTIDGGQSDDVVYAGDGNDLIFGGDAGDAAGGGAANAKTVDSFVFDTSSATSVSEGSGPGNTGDSITYNNIATADDGTPISVRITIVSVSDSDLDVELGSSDAYPLFLEGGNQGATADIQIDFLDQNGDPVSIDSNFTFRDIDDTGANGHEGVTFDTTDITSYAVSDDPPSSVQADNRGDVIEFTTNTSGGSGDENLWTQVFFEGQSTLNFTVEARAGNAGYGFDTANFSNTPVISEVDASGDDLLYGGTGDDSALGGGGTDTIYGDEGRDTLDGGAGDDTLYGGEGDDVLFAGAGSNTIFGGDGQDTVDYSTSETALDIDLDKGEADGSGFSDEISGVEVIIGSDHDDKYDGSDNGDTFFGGLGVDDINGGDGDDVLYGGEGEDKVKGGKDDDTVYGGSGDDEVKGEDGNDTVFGGDGADDVKGGKGDDSLDGGADDDEIKGEDGDDVLTGGTGTDTLYGGKGDDTWAFDDNSSTDTFHGDDGSNTVDASGASSGITVNFSTTAGTIEFGGQTASFSDAQSIILTGHDDVVFATADTAGVSVDGGAGDDSLTGGEGDDTLRGGDGADTIDAGAGQNTVSGGDGSDTFVINGADYSSLGTEEEIQAALVDLNLAGIENWHAAKGVDTSTDTSTGTDPSAIDVKDIGKEVNSSTKWLLGGKKAKDAEKLVEDAVEDFLSQNGDAPITAKDISDLTYEVLEPEYGMTVAGSAGIAVYQEAKEQLDASAGVESEGTLEQDILALATHNTIEDFELGTDTLDLSGIDYLGTDGLSTNDVKVTDTAGDGTGDAVLNLPDGSTITLQNISVYDLDPETLESMGFSASDDTTGFQNEFLTAAGIIGGGGGDDAIAGSAADEDISGGTGADTIVLGGGADTVDGGDDADAIVVDDGFDGATIDGGNSGDDADKLDFSSLSTGITVSATSGDDGTLSDGAGSSATFSDIENIEGSESSDIIDLSAGSGSGSNSVDASVGDDSVAGGDGDDILLGGEGDDTVRGDAGSDTVYGGEGDDSLSTGTGDDTVFGGDGNDRIANSSGDDVLYGGTGNDDVIASLGDDTLYGGTGTDSMIGGLDNDALYGGDGSDILYGGADPADPAVADPKFSYEFYELDGNSLTDLASAGFDSTGNTTLTPDGHGTTDEIDVTALDTAHGGDGETFAVKLSTVLTVTTGGTYTFETASDDGSKLFVNGVEIVANDGLHGVQVQSGSLTLGPGEHTVEIVYFENTGGEALSATISGPDTGGSPIALETANVVPSDDDALFGGAGNDTLFGGEGDDTLTGGVGDDTLQGGAGSDEIFGGDGNDSLTTGTGNDTLFGGAGNDNLANSAGDDILYGGTGDDSILASLGNDTLYGGAGNDELDGGVDNDVLYGGEGEDTLTGGAGNDLLYGGDDDDVFVASAGDDTIADFSVGDDLLDTSSLTDVGNVLANQDGTVTADEVTVTGGGGSDQVLTFPSGETITVPDGTVDTTTQQAQFASLVAMGVPPCFAEGTLILTTEGERPVEDLRVGDLVETADHGLKPVRWIGKRSIDFTDPNYARTEQDKPVLIRSGSIGHGLPLRDLVVSPQHRMVIWGDDVVERTGEQEVFALAKSLTPLPGVRRMRGRQQVTYYAILLDRHCVIFAEGTPTETFRPGPVAMAGLSKADRGLICAVYPGLMSEPESALGPSARQIISRKDAEAIARQRRELEFSDWDADLADETTRTAAFAASR